MRTRRTPAEVLQDLVATVVGAPEEEGAKACPRCGLRRCTHPGGGLASGPLSGTKSLEEYREEAARWEKGHHGKT